MYNNDPKFMNPQQGLASLVNSPYRDSDVMQVKMTPNEVAGLQQLALHYGANEQDLYDPVTGQPKFSFLKKLLPTIAGAILNTVAPGVGGAVGKFFGLSGAAASTLGTGLLVGGATALIEGDLKKGLMAGLGAYGGANLAQSLQAAAAAPAAPSAEEVVKAAEATDAAKSLVGAGEGAVMNPVSGAPAASPTSRFISSSNQALRGESVPALSAASNAQFDKAGNLIMSEALSKPTSVSGLPGILEGGKSLLTNPNARGAFMQGLGGGFESPMAQNLSRYATFAGVADAFTPEYQMPSGEEEGASVYIPGAINPMYGYGRQYGYFLPGQYYKRTKKGLVPYNPYAMAPGYAAGGMVQPRVIPEPSQPYPYPNQNYPLSTVTQTNYAANSPQGREILSGYDTKIDPFTGEEKFADGGAVFDPTPRYKDPATVDPNADNSNVRLGSNPPTGVAPPKGPPLVTLPVEPPVGPPPITLPPDNPFDPARQRYMDMINAPPKPPVDTKAVMDYVADLNRRAKNPEFIAFPPGGTGGTGTDTTKPPPEKPDPDCPAGYTYDRVAGACVPIKDVTNPPTPPTPPKSPPGTTITPPPPPPKKKEEPKKDEPKKDEPAKTGDEDKDDKGIVDRARDAFNQWFNKRFGNVYGLIGTGIGLTSAGMLGTYLWDKYLTPAIKEQVGKMSVEGRTDEQALNDILEAETEKMLEQLQKDVAAVSKPTTPPPPPPPPPSSRGGGVGLPGGGPGGGRPVGGGPITGGGGRRGYVGTNPGYIDNGDGTYSDAEGNIYDEDGNLIEEARIAARTGGRIRAMQAGGMTAPNSPLPPPVNPYGAAVGEDYNFGFSGGGATEYAAAGKLLEGEGDGMSDDIPAVIRGKGVQRAALADGEFVVPADVVSHLGNGSTKAGAKKLYAMMDRIREARTGRTRQAPEVKPERYLPA